MTFYRARKCILHTQLHDESVLLNLDSGHYFSLNPVGSWLWSLLLAEPRSEQKLLAEMNVRYQESEQRLAEDLHELLQDLLRNGLIEVTDGTDLPHAAPILD